MSKKKIVVLGTGMVGSAIAIDLNLDFDVTAVDINKNALEALQQKHGIKTVQTDLSVSRNVVAVIRDQDLVIGAVPGFMGYQTVRNVIRTGKNMVDISFFPQDPFRLHDEALSQDVTVVVDCGVAPGMSNIFLGYYDGVMEVKSYRCLVGGLPKVREWPFEYKAVFSPMDVIEEYVRPARFIEHSGEVVRPALSDAELVNFPGIGTLEAWNSDGLRTLLKTIKIPNMIEKTLRYPGTIDYLKMLRESGFFSYDEIDVNGKKIRPIDLTARLLFDQWKLNPGEEDFTVMRVEIAGNNKRGEAKLLIYDMFDQYDRKSETTSMARTTGYTCTAIARLMLDGKIEERGIVPPEYAGRNEENFNFILSGLAERGIEYKLR
ncbi:MAG: saccharopine dehydrogenase [Chlorobi bacterium]|nr:saccharopine dehydrogenase [Chlorobiota bacterium]